MTIAMAQQRPVQLTSTDWLKLVGIAAFMIDHVGLYFIDDDDAWRLLGRIAAPIFFFLVGFARSRHIPLSWIIWGVILTGLDWYIDGWDELTLNILLNFAFLRLALRFVDHFAQTPMRFLVVAALAVFCLPFGDEFFEYGAEGWLWALFGYAQRLWRDDRKEFALPRFALASVAVLAYAFAEINHHEWDGLYAIGLVMIVLVLTGVFLLFARRVSPWQPPVFLAAPLIWIAHYSLEIYAISLFVMQDIAHVID